MIGFDYWIKENRSFYDCNRGTAIIWKGKFDEDLYQMSKDFFSCAYLVTDDIVRDNHNNGKYDMWFLSCVYMFRQSLELLQKALVAKSFQKRHDIEVAFNEDKHDLVKLLTRYI